MIYIYIDLLNVQLGGFIHTLVIY